MSDKPLVLKLKGNFLSANNIDNYFSLKKLFVFQVQPWKPNEGTRSWVPS